MSIDNDKRILKVLRDLPGDAAAKLLRRANMQIEFAREFAEALPADKTDGWDKLISTANSALEELDPSTGTKGLSDVVAGIEAVLAPIGAVAKTYRVHCVGHGHIDMNWMWSWQETVSTTHDTFASVLELMDQYPDFTYSQSQASVYSLIERFHPRMFERIRQRVTEGRWEVTAAHWVEGDKNLSSGESLTRHLLYTRRYFAEKFGMSPEDLPIDWEPDTFGHAATLPTILAQGGVKYYYSCRQGGGFGHPILGEPRPALYYWEAPDGSRILVNRELTWYIGYIGMSENVALPLAKFTKENGLHEWLMVYGVGNHGGGPTRAELANFHEQQAWPIYPELVFSTSKAYFDAVSKEIAASKIELPVIKHELNYEFTGCYTSQSLIKQANRFGENYLEEAEAMAAIAARVAGADYSRDLLRDAWINVLFNQFHDILPGSGVRQTREHAMTLFQEVGAITGAIKKEATTALTSQIDTASLLPDTPKGRAERALIQDGNANRLYEAGAGHTASVTGFSYAMTGGKDFKPLVIFNPNPFPRTERVTVILYDTGFDPNRVVVLDDTGTIAAVDPISVEPGWINFHQEIKVAFDAVDVPAHGYCTYLFTEGDAPETEPQAWVGKTGAIETPLLSVKFDALRSGLLQLTDKRSGAELAVGAIGQWKYVTEKPRGMTSWTLGVEPEPAVPLKAKRFRIFDGLGEMGEIGNGYSVIGEFRKSKTGFRATWELEVPGTQSTVKVNALLAGREPRIDFTAEIDWREIGDDNVGIPGLLISFPLSLHGIKSRYEIPFGSVERSLFHGEEVPALRWANLSGTSMTSDGKEVPAAVTLLQDCKYGHSIDGHELRLRIVRSSFDPDHAPEVARTTVRYSIYLHGGEPDAASLTRLGTAFNHPMIVAPTKLQTGSAATTRGFVRAITESVALTAVKQPEDGDGLILRLAELNGKAVEAEVELTEDVAKGLKSVTLVDLIERPIPGEVSFDGKRVKVGIKAFGLVTVKLS